MPPNLAGMPAVTCGVRSPVCESGSTAGGGMHFSGRESGSAVSGGMRFPAHEGGSNFQTKPTFFTRWKARATTLIVNACGEARFGACPDPRPFLQTCFKRIL
jgi:hypothetical protein